MIRGNFGALSLMSSSSRVRVLFSDNEGFSLSVTVNMRSYSAIFSWLLDISLSINSRNVNYQKCECVFVHFQLNLDSPPGFKLNILCVKCGAVTSNSTWDRICNIQLKSTSSNGFDIQNNSLSIFSTI